MKTNKTLFITCVLVFTTTYLGAQTTITLSTARLDGGKDTACKLITLKPGFKFKATSTASLTLTVNPMVCDPYAGAAFPASDNQNYIRTRNYTSADSSRYLETIQYFDGLGRPIETVQRCITPAAADLVTCQEYDALGREDRTWLPAVAADNYGDFMTQDTYRAKAAATYNNTTCNAAADSVSYNRPVYEASPLNRVIEQYAPGADWQKNDKSVKTAYQTNSGISGVLSCALFTATGTGVNRKIYRSNYINTQLYVTQTTDEDGNTGYEFKNKLGQVVLKRQILNGVSLDTYFTYDEYSNLCFVLPPMASEALIAANNVLYDETNSDPIKQYAYIYKYDSRSRCVAKKLPGCEWIYYVYDMADHLIFTQDGESRKAGVWQFSIPDVFGRIVLTGTCMNIFDYATEPLKTVVVKADRSNDNNSFKGYEISSGVPLVSPTVLSVNYYDDYAFLGYNGIPNNTNTQYIAETGYDACYGDHQTANASKSKGLLTGTLTAQMNPDGTIASTYLYSVMYYDDRGRVVQTKSNNHLQGGLEKEYVAYNFTGQPTEKKHIHQATGKATQTEVYANTYDHAGRLTKETYQLNGGTIIILAENTYDELGRLKTNMKGGQANLNATYAYNIRSWVKSITSPLFVETLYYNESYGGSVKLYNGNLSAMSWKQPSQFITRGYTFFYNNLSWLTAANYLENESANNNYSTAYTYNNQGCIKTLQRYGKTMATMYGLIDNLTLDYSGNQLLKVEDTAPNITIAESADFKNYSNEAAEYIYNANGAMTKDLNKGISDIQYNLLNLPRLMDIKSPVAEARNEYTYSTDGKKLKVVQKWNPDYSTAPVIGSAINTDSLTMNKTTDYIGNIIYENGVLKRILIDGGYIENGVYYYYLTDHQGNNRLVFDTGYSNIIQTNHYYPFGMAFAETPILQQGKQPYKYGNKELDMMNGLNLYDNLARLYDPAFPHTLTMDPLCEKYYSISPYSWCANNPVNAIDSKGKDIIILSAPSHVGGLGHAAVLIGNDETGWYLYSKNGTNGSSGGVLRLIGPEDHTQDENNTYFSSLTEFANSSSNFDMNEYGDVTYTSAYRIMTNKDDKMKEAASKSVSSYYIFIGQSCIDVCSEALSAGGLNPGEKQFDRRSVIPNTRYEQIKTYNNGVDVTKNIIPTDETKNDMKANSKKVKETKEKSEQNQIILNFDWNNLNW